MVDTRSDRLSTATCVELKEQIHQRIWDKRITIYVPSNMAEAVIILTCILEVSCSNLGRNTSRDFLVSLSSLGKCWHSGSNQVMTISFHILSNSLLILPFDTL